MALLATRTLVVCGLAGLMFYHYFPPIAPAYRLSISPGVFFCYHILRSSTSLTEKKTHSIKVAPATYRPWLFGESSGLEEPVALMPEPHGTPDNNGAAAVSEWLETRATRV